MVAPTGGHSREDLAMGHHVSIPCCVASIFAGTVTTSTSAEGRVSIYSLGSILCTTSSPVRLESCLKIPPIPTLPSLSNP